MRDYQGGNWIYTRPGCGWCVKAKELLKEHNVQFQEIVLDGKDNNKDSMNADIGRNDLNTIPQLIINGGFLPGGYKGLSEYFERQKVTA